jgi:pimeloyl-ACP methyl ester carboxylesterase
LRPIFGHDLAEQPPVVAKQLKAMGSYDATSRLSELSGLPTLVVSASHDRIARPEFGRALAAGVPGSRYLEIANASHGLPIEHPGQINQLLLDHFAQTELGPGGTPRK